VAAPVAAPVATPAATPTPAPVKAELPGPPEAPLTYFKDMQITFKEKSTTTGVIGFDFHVSGAPTKRTWIKVLAKTDSDDIAELVAKELTFTLGTEYKVKSSDEEVRLEASGKNAKPFAITVAGMTVNGVSVRVDED
jgi:hypothetical protein